MNQSLFNLIFSLSHRILFVDSIMVALASQLPYFLGLGALYLIFRSPGSRQRIFLFIETALALILARGLLTEIIRFFYHHARPFEALNIEPLFLASGSSFPSGHAAFFFALAMTFWLYDKKWGAWFFLFALVNGFARVYAGVHWPMDIVGGIAVGILSAMAMHRLLLAYRERIEEITEEGEIARA